MAAIESVIQGSEKLTRISGCWPSFHDAEIIELHLWRGDVDAERQRYVFPVLTVKLHHWELTREIDRQGFLVTKHHTVTTLRFHNLEEGLKLDDFNHQNVIFELIITQKQRDDGPSPYFDVQFVSSFGMAAHFRCFQIEVLDAVPHAKEGDPDVQPSAAQSNNPTLPLGNSGGTEDPSPVVL